MQLLRIEGGHLRRPWTTFSRQCRKCPNLFVNPLKNAHTVWSTATIFFIVTKLGWGNLLTGSIRHKTLWAGLRTTKFLKPYLCKHWPRATKCCLVTGLGKRRVLGSIIPTQSIGAGHSGPKFFWDPTYVLKVPLNPNQPTNPTYTHTIWHRATKFFLITKLDDGKLFQISARPQP